MSDGGSVQTTAMFGVVFFNLPCEDWIPEELWNGVASHELKDRTLSLIVELNDLFDRL